MIEEIPTKHKSPLIRKTYESDRDKSLEEGDSIEELSEIDQLPVQVQITTKEG